MRTKEEIAAVANMTGKEIEKTIGMRLNSGQGTKEVKKTINWVLGNINKVQTVQEKYTIN